MHKARKFFSSGLVAALVAAAFMVYAPEAGAGVRVIRRAACPPPAWYAPPVACPAPVYIAPRHVHTYGYQEQRRLIGFNDRGYPVYQVIPGRVRTCGC